MPEELEKDLGLGGRLGDQNRERLLNRDGTFNVKRVGLPRGSLNAYHQLLTISWRKFHLLVLTAYLLVNVCFAMGYLLCGPGALSGGEADTTAGRFSNAFFFSVQTLATIGYGKMTPEGHAANALVAFEALVGLLGFAFITGLMFARFSRPLARILYSRNAIIAPFQGGLALMFRILNANSSEMSDLKATVTLSRNETSEGRSVRRFYTLQLERDSVMFLPVQWVLVHPIDASSPLYGWTEEQARKSNAEIFVLLSGIDETFAQQVHSRTSYRADELVWGAKFSNMYGDGPGADGILRIDARKLDDFERVPLP